MSSTRNALRIERQAPTTARHPINRIVNACNHLEAGDTGGAIQPLGPGVAAVRAAFQAESTISTGAAEAQSRKFERKSLRLNADQYLPQRHQKNLIVLHFTAGTTCESAYRTWAGNPDRIATAFGIDPDGSIVEFFPPECWAYHLGVKGTHRHDQRSIGIEIANVGPLKLAPGDPGQLNWWPRNWGVPYCSIGDTEHYCRSSYRGIDYFASMPEIQQQAVGVLVTQLCERFSIPRLASQAARNGEFDPQAFAGYAGVATHSNFRRDKWDVGPAFNWDRLGF